MEATQIINIITGTAADTETGNWTETKTVAEDIKTKTGHIRTDATEMKTEKETDTAAWKSLHTSGAFLHFVT